VGDLLPIHSCRKLLGTAALARPELGRKRQQGEGWLGCPSAEKLTGPFKCYVISGKSLLCLHFPLLLYNGIKVSFASRVVGRLGDQAGETSEWHPALSKNSVVVAIWISLEVLKV
jgi:hypothetical protein